MILTYFQLLLLGNLYQEIHEDKLEHETNYTQNSKHTHGNNETTPIDTPTH